MVRVPKVEITFADGALLVLVDADVEAEGLTDLILSRVSNHHLHTALRVVVEGNTIVVRRGGYRVVPRTADAP
jgi:hypothetical protein